MTYYEYNIWQIGNRRYQRTSRWLLFLGQAGFLVKKEDSDEPGITVWWRGFGGIIDFTNVEAVKWFVSAYLLSAVHSRGYCNDSLDACQEVAPNVLCL